ncbi:MAG: peptide chain release factor 1, partial [Planctomycetota bacterium]
MSQQDNSLLAKLDELDERYVEIERQISAPDVASDADKFIPLSKEQGKLKPIVAKYREYKG